MFNVRKSIDSFIQSQVEPPIQFYMQTEAQTDLKLATDVSLNDTVLVFEAGHGCVAGEYNYITIWEDNQFSQLRIIAVDGNNVTIGIPIPKAYTTEATIVRGSINMAVDGSVTSQKFYFRPTNIVIPLDISEIKIIMTHTADGDSDKFGGITKLTNGFYMRRYNGYTFNYGNYRSNGDFESFGGTYKKDDKAPSGVYGTVITFPVEDVFTKEIRIDGRSDEYLECVIRDDNTNTSMRVSLLGSYTQGE